jgi:glucose/arabinose dehydrogenase
MKTSARVILSTVFAFALGLAATSSAHALPVISNGGFESGFTSWTRADQVGSDGTFASQSGTVSPVNGASVPAPPEGTMAAMTDAQGPGSHVLYQDFTATAGSAALSFALFIGNRASLEGGFAGFATPASLDFSTPTLNQQARVDILNSTADPFSVAAPDVFANLYQTKAGDPLVSGYNTITTDITALLAAHVGETLRLRFAETDNVSPFQLGVDNVRFDQVQIPEPASILLFGAALALLVGWRGRGLLAAHRCMGVVAMLGAVISYHVPARADTTPLTVLDPNLQVTTVLSAGITQPIGIVFLGANDFLVLEKASGLIKRVINGVIQPNPVLDLAVNSNSERGLLSMVLHPNFPTIPFTYVRWTESNTGADSGVVSEVPLTGNRLDRFVWNGSTLTFDRNLIMLRSRQTDNLPVPGHPGPTNANEQGNHNGGVLRFGPDGKLYLFMGDQGRRGLMQNLPNGPFLTPPIVDDNFGGPMPDNAHLSGVILRLNDDGSTPTDNPFFAVGGAMGGEVGANIQKVFSYGHRNGFGMAFDPYSGALWETENADDAYSELNRVVPGMNGGWVQLAGPLSRIADWKFIETTQFGSALQQVRYPPTRAAYTASLALSRMFMLPGAIYVDPDLSWRYEIGPAGTTFVKGAALGTEYDGTLWMGSARSFQQVGNNGGSLYLFALTTNRLHVDVSADPRLADRVADNLFSPTKFEGTESETLQIGKGFGTTPSIEQGPDGNLYVVSVTDNAIYKISRKPPP